MNQHTSHMSANLVNSALMREVVRFYTVRVLSILF